MMHTKEYVTGNWRFKKLVSLREKAKQRHQGRETNKSRDYLKDGAVVNKLPVFLSYKHCDKACNAGSYLVKYFLQ